MNIDPNDAAVVKAIQDGVTTTVVVAKDGREYFTREVFSAPSYVPTALEVHTLSGLIDFVKANIDMIADERRMFWVESPTSVRVVSSLSDRKRTREHYVLATANDAAKAFRFGNFYEAEEFNIALQSLFVRTPERDALLALVGNMKQEVVDGAEDDGVTQTVTARRGVALVTQVSVPNPVLLAPYRTFTQIEQPISPFVLRVKKGSNLPMCALFEADGSQWRDEAISSIKDWLESELKDRELTIPVIA